jgi:hypothetical protein
MVRYTLEQRVFLHDTYMKYGSARKCRRKLRSKFRDERVPSRQIFHNFNLDQRDSYYTRNKTHECRVFTEEKLDDIGASLEHTPRKSLKHLAQETRVSKSSTRTATELLKLRPYKTTVVQARLSTAPFS